MNVPRALPIVLARQCLVVIIDSVGWPQDQMTTAISQTRLNDGSTQVKFTLRVPPEVILDMYQESFPGRRLLAFEGDTTTLVDESLAALFEQGTLVSAFAASGLAASLGYDNADLLLSAMTPDAATIGQPQPPTVTPNQLGNNLQSGEGWLTTVIIALASLAVLAAALGTARKLFCHARNTQEPTTPVVMDTARLVLRSSETE